MKYADGSEGSKRSRVAVMAAMTPLLVALVVGTTAAPAGRAGLGNLVLASTTKPLATGAATFTFPDGITLTLAPGWTITNSTPSGIAAVNGDNSAAIAIASGGPHASDINGDMAWSINDDIKINDYTNVVRKPSPDGVQTIVGKHFTQELTIGYTATYQSDQGALEFNGIWMTLFNPSTQLNAFIDFRAATSEGYAAALPDAASMIASIV
jgi:hypothetical protein